MEEQQPMQRYLVAYVSREGQTEKIAHHVARQLEDCDALVRLIDVKAHETEAGADDCDAVIIAGSVHRARFDPELSAFIMRHGPALRRCPSAFLPVSLSAASHEPSDRAAIDEVVQNYLAELGWKPDEVFHVAGAVHDRQLNLLERTALHAILNMKGVEPHPSGDTELTDWTALDEFLRGFRERVKAQQPTAPEPGAGP
jgi:menaquinone-dependent protoporphyrinogen oxidase